MANDPSKGLSSAAEAETFAADLDVGARNPDNWQGTFIAAVALVWAFLQVFNASPVPAKLALWTGQNWMYVTSDTERVIHLAFGLVMATIAFPLLKSSSRNRIPWYDWVLCVLGVSATMYLIFNSSAIADRSGLPTTGDLVASAVGLCVVLIATFRALGLPMVIVASVFLLYVFFGNNEIFPEAMQWKGASFGKAMWHFWMQTEGVFGLALGVSASMVFLFVLFGSLLEKAGAGNYFIKLAFALMGHLKGGPAKAAVVASAATGLISGSSIANTVTTGTFTIPLMKRVGFSSEKAGAIEVAASTNGQLTPPVMGAAAFLMVEYVGISYFDVITHAFLPAIISYIALVYIVHLEALKANMKGLPKPGTPRPWQRRLIGLSFNIAMVAGLGIGVYYLFGWMPGVFGGATPYVAGLIILAVYLLLVRYASSVPDLELDDPDAPVFELPETKKVVPTGLHFILPIVVLVYCLMVLRWSPGLSAFWATTILIFIILTQRPLIRMFRKEADLIAGFRQGFAEFVDGLIAGARNMIGIGVAVAAAGIIVGAVTETSVGLKLAEVVEYLSFGSVLIMLIWTAILCIVLGLGLPTTANYIVVSAIMAPVIVVVGQQNGLIVPLIAVHLFVFYFGILADDTPPVGLAAFAAAAVSGGDPIKTGIQGFMYDIRTGVLPFMFIFNTDLLLIDVSIVEGIAVFIIAVIALLCFSAATQGYFFARSKVYETIILLVVALTFFRPGLWMDTLIAPWDKVSPDKLMETVAKAEVGSKIRFYVKTETDAGKPFQKFVQFKVGNGKTAAARLKQYGVVIIKEDGQWIVDRVEEGSAAKKIDQKPSDEIKSVFKPSDQPPKQLFYIPAALLLLLVIVMQRRRIRPGDAKGADAGTTPASATA